MQEFGDLTGHVTKPGAAMPGVGLPFVTLAMLGILPSGVFFFLAPSGTVSSLAPGTIGMCLMALGLLGIGAVDPIPTVRLSNYAALAVAIACAIAVHFVGSVLVIGSSEVGRTLLSLPILLLMFGGAMALAAIFEQSTASLDRALAIIRWLLIGVAIVAIADIHPVPSSWDKPVFPFSEPSHLALVLNPLLIHACVTARGAKRALWIAGGLMLAYAAESLTLVIGMIVAALLCLPITGFVVAAVIGAGLLPLVDLGYFTDRLNFDAGTQNLSSLIYRQGWELAGDALHRTSGWGVGFQQLGYAPFHSPSADVIYSILQTDTNTADGGFLLAKIVSEFGVIGVFLIISYIVFATKTAISIRRFASGTVDDFSPPVVFAMCVVCGFSIDVFVRDVGYFSSSVLMFISAVFLMLNHRSGEINFTRYM